MIVAIYPGSFDPITHGHLDIATRAARLFDKVIIAVYQTPRKQLIFSAEERVKLARGAVASLPNVEVKSFGGLLVDFAREIVITLSSRGCRITSRTVLLNSGSSSRNNTPLCPREISPGCGNVPPPTSATSEIV